MAVTRTSDLAKARKARLELHTRAGTYPTPADANYKAPKPMRGGNAAPPAGASKPTDRDEYETNEEFGFRTPRKRKGS